MTASEQFEKNLDYLVSEFLEDRTDQIAATVYGVRFQAFQASILISIMSELETLNDTLSEVKRRI